MIDSHPLRPAVPNHWSAQQALAVFELVEHLRDQLWARYHLDVQSAMRADCAQNAQLPLQLDNPPL